MTIRDTLKKKLKIAIVAGLVGWLIFAGGAILLENQYPAIFIVGFILFGGAIIYAFYFVRCPKCNAPIGQIFSMPGYSFLSKHKVNFCPSCGVEMDSNNEYKYMKNETFSPTRKLVFYGDVVEDMFELFFVKDHQCFQKIKRTANKYLFS